MTTDTIKELVAKIAIDGYRDGSSTRAGVPYQPIPFDEFADIPAQKGDRVRAEWEKVRELAQSPDRVLDIGANIGFYSFMLAKEGATDVMAVERDPDNVAVLKALATWSGLAVQVRPTVWETMNGTYDLVLMLNVHHWIHKSDGEERTNLLMRMIALNCRQLIFQTAHLEGGAFYTVPGLRNEDDIALYLTRMGFHDVRAVGKTMHGKERVLFSAKGAIV